jgi:hypothetical protein
VLWRYEGHQRSLTFENLPAAERFKSLPKDQGPDEALCITEVDEASRLDAGHDRRCRTKLRKGSLFAANICAAGELRGWPTLIYRLCAHVKRVGHDQN